MNLWGSGFRRICAVAAAGQASEMRRQVLKAVRHTPTVELRLDWLQSDKERGVFLGWLQRSRLAEITLIATCRRKIAGGKFQGTVKAELAWLGRAREAGCAWCDLEVESLAKIPPGELRAFALPRVLLSLHDFRGTPALNDEISRKRPTEIKALKIAAMANSLDDSLRLLNAAKRSGIVPVPMGEIGLPARILAMREGSPLAYAPIDHATAPGQVSLHELMYIYRAHKITRRTRVYGVIGQPIGHSLSPLLHNTGYVARKLDAVYLPFLVKDLGEFLKAVPEFGLRGFSVTLPHKQRILEHLAACDPLAARIGAVNTVTVLADGSLYGCNTDYVGVLAALEKNLRLDKSRVLIVGAGGSARAAAFALVEAGAAVFICARREKAASSLAKDAGCEAIARRLLPTASFDAILNATPVGMYPRVSVSPLASSELNCRIVMDLVYRPEKTRLLKLAARKGIATVSGVEMFLAQGVAQWELWMGQAAPINSMRKAVLRALQAESSRPNSQKSGNRK